MKANWKIKYMYIEQISWTVRIVRKTLFWPLSTWTIQNRPLSQRLQSIPLRFENRKRSLEAKSGEYGGWNFFLQTLSKMPHELEAAKFETSRLCLTIKQMDSILVVPILTKIRLSSIRCQEAYLEPCCF